ncbi:hypothetical protein KC350_g94 [Hortaea werneckii]|nr:hypothetical protein KC350_g94 [Hortaea werneckii]
MRCIEQAERLHWEEQQQQQGRGLVDEEVLGDGVVGAGTDAVRMERVDNLRGEGGGIGVEEVMGSREESPNHSIYLLSLLFFVSSLSPNKKAKKEGGGGRRRLAVNTVCRGDTCRAFFVLAAQSAYLSTRSLVKKIGRRRVAGRGERGRKERKKRGRDCAKSEKEVGSRRGRRRGEFETSIAAISKIRRRKRV